MWFESHDDITLIWNDNDDICIEFVQVKAVDATSRWSLKNITSRDNNRVGTSLVEKSLMKSIYLEKSKFRIVTSYDVSSELSILKFLPGSQDRKDRQIEIEALSRNIIDKIGDIKSSDGTSISSWIKRCYWDKQPDSRESLIHKNLITLGQIIYDYGEMNAPDVVEAIYGRILAKVQKASTDELLANNDANKITKGEFNLWLRTALEHQIRQPISAEKLQEKMSIVHIDNDIIETAKELRIDYLEARIKSDFIKPSIFPQIEAEAKAILSTELSKLDAGITAEEGIHFHQLCIEKLNEIPNSQPFKSHEIPQYIFHGYMYERTNRCVHRFGRPRP